MVKLPHHRLISEARRITKAWYEPHPGARHHDQAVAETLITHMTNAGPELIAAAVIGHSFALAPAEVAVIPLLTRRLNPRIAGVVSVLQNENEALTTLHGPPLSLYMRLLIQSNPDAVCVSAADKIVILTKLGTVNSVVNNQMISALRTYYRFFYNHAAPHLPATLGDKLGELLAALAC